MNKEQLKLKYGSERVLCVKQFLLDQWFACEKNPVKALIEAIEHHGTFNYRYDAEIDFDTKQIIPYVVVYNKDKTKVYVTERLGGDHRLVGQVSIGLGGHIDTIDMAETKSAIQGINNNIIRELEEETTGTSFEEIAFRTVFIDESNEVSKVHACLLVTCTTEEDGFEIKETEKLKGYWVAIDELMSRDCKMESWASIAFKILHGVTPTKEIKNEETKAVKEETSVSTNGTGDTTKKYTNKKSTKTKRKV